MGRQIQLLFVTGPMGADGAVDVAGQNGKGIIARAANDLCRYYAVRDGIQAKILRVPYLYTASPTLEDPILTPLFEACSQGSAVMRAGADSPLGALCAEELAVLVRRIFDSWDATFEELEVPDSFAHTVETWARRSRACSRGSTLPTTGTPSSPLLRAIPSARATGGSSAMTCCAIFRPYTPAGSRPSRASAIRCVPPSTACAGGHCPSNAWRPRWPGCSLRAWSWCFRSLLSLTCSTTACCTWYWSARCMGSILAWLRRCWRRWVWPRATLLSTVIPSRVSLRAVQLAAVYCVLCGGCRVRLCAAAQQRSH